MKAPRSKKKYQIGIENFCGIDLRNTPSKVDFSRSPMCPNMIRETKGNNRKRRGYETLCEIPNSRINGFHILKTPTIEKVLIHAKNGIYELLENDGAYSTNFLISAKDEFSMSKQFQSNLYIFDGMSAKEYTGTNIRELSQNAYIPTTTIAKTYQGGGTAYEPLNLIQPKRTERFTGDNEHKTFQLGASNLDSDTVTVKSMQSNGTFTTLTEGTHFNVNRIAGTVTFNQAYPTPITGADNLYITYAKTVQGYADKINKCTICTLYGMNGARDRMFVSGNPDYPNFDWYCKSNDPTMWGDTWYSVIGQSNSAIVGYSIVGDYQVIHKDHAENDSNAILRRGNYDPTNGYTFTTAGSYSAIGALGKHTFVQFDNEPLYLSIDKNIHAITPNDIFGERASQERSYYISTELAKEDNLKEAYACQYDGFYMLAINDRVYILDSTQIVTEKNRPYATRQYECYMFTGIGARVISNINDRLYFGTKDGKIKRFFADDSQSHFIDDGVTKEVTVMIDGEEKTYTESYPCYWDTCEMYGTAAELKKTFRHLAIALNSFPHTGCRVYAKIDGIWEIIFDYDTNANYFDFNDIDFNEFTFRTDSTPTLVGGKFKAKKLLHLQLRFENSRPQPFSILFAIIKYTIGGEYIK